jgi:hypothetical protein
MIGLDRIAGWFEAGVVDEWERAGHPLGSVPQISVAELARELDTGRLTVIDVRGRAEWDEGHLPGVANIPVGYLVDRIAEIPRDRTVVVHCQAGSRSMRYRSPSSVGVEGSMMLPIRRPRQMRRPAPSGARVASAASARVSRPPMSGRDEHNSPGEGKQECAALRRRRSGGRRCGFDDVARRLPLCEPAGEVDDAGHSVRPQHAGGDRRARAGLAMHDDR